MECNTSKLYKEALKGLENKDKFNPTNSKFSTVKTKEGNSYRSLKRNIKLKDGSSIYGVQKDNSDILVGRDKNGANFTISKEDAIKNESHDTDEIKSSLSKEIKQLEKIIPSGSYIHPRDFNKYKPDISDEDKAYLYARQGLGYLNDTGPGLSKIEQQVLLDSKSVRDGSMSEKDYNTKYRGLPDNLGQRYIIGENGADPQELLDSISENYNKTIGDVAHNRASVIIDKPLYVTKTGEVFNGEVSAFATSPEDIVSFGRALKGDKIYKLPKGSKVTFADRAGLPHEGSRGRFEEIVLDSKLLKEAPKRELLAVRRASERLKKKYTKLILQKDKGISKEKANFMVEKQHYRLNDYSKLYSILGLGGVTGISKAQQEKSN